MLGTTAHCAMPTGKNCSSAGATKAVLAAKALGDDKFAKVPTWMSVKQRGGQSDPCSRPYAVSASTSTARQCGIGSTLASKAHSTRGAHALAAGSKATSAGPPPTADHAKASARSSPLDALRQPTMADSMPSG